VVANNVSTLVQFNSPPTNIAFQNLFTFGVEEPINRFVGRKKELTELKAALTCGIERRWLVVGSGGMGKSQLMKKFLFDNRNENNCVWLHGESVPTLSSSVDSLFRKIQHQDRDSVNSSITHHIHAIVHYIRTRSNRRPWIFIIDNVDENHSAARTVVTALVRLSNVKTFVTSRLRNIFGGSAVIVEVKPLSVEDAQSYVNKFLPKNRSPELVSQLCVTLQNHPLALSQAVDYIVIEQLFSVNENFSIENYLKALQSQREKLLKHKAYDESTTVFHTCCITMDAIRKKHGRAGRIAISLLRRLVYFDPDGVPQSVFNQFLSKSILISQPLFEEGLGLLKSFSLIWIEDKVISVHRLVQRVTKLEIQNLWWPNQYTNQLFKKSKHFLWDSTKVDPVILHQTRFIFQHIVKNDLKICVGDFDEWNFINFSLVGEIHSALKEKEVPRAVGLIKRCLEIVRLKRPNMSNDFATSSYIDILETLSRRIENHEGNAREALESAMWLMNAYRENCLAWMNVEYNFDHDLYMKSFERLIEKEKYPIRFRMREIKEKYFG
jgi:hypothetical protein